MTQGKTELITLYAVMYRDQQGNEEIVGTGAGQMVTGSLEVKPMLVAMAKNMAKIPGKKPYLIEYKKTGIEEAL